jgi:hypothetical protein
MLADGTGLYEDETTFRLLSPVHRVDPAVEQDQVSGRRRLPAPASLPAAPRRIARRDGLGRSRHRYAAHRRRAGDRPGPQYRPPRYPGALPFALLVTAHLPDYLRL